MTVGLCITAWAIANIVALALCKAAAQGDDVVGKGAESHIPGGLPTPMRLCVGNKSPELFDLET